MKEDLSWLNHYNSSGNLAQRISAFQKYGHREPFGLDLIEFVGHEKLLDIGCGTSIKLVEPARKSKGRGLVVGLDLAMGMCRASHDAFASMELPAQFICADAVELPFAAGMFDVVSSTYMLFHVSDIQKCLNEIKRVLKPDGRAVVTLTAHDYVWQLADIHDSALKQFPDAKRLPNMSEIFSIREADQLFPKIFSHIDRRLHNNRMTFRTPAEFMEYYATMPRFLEAFPDAERRELLRAEAENMASQRIARDGDLVLDAELATYIMRK